LITVTSTQLEAWLVAFMFPLARILALLASAPVFNNAAMPAMIRLASGLAITIVLAPALPSMPPLPPGSWSGLLVLAEQILIGLLMGFTLRIIFTAVDIAGDLIGLQMSLSFAMLYDPQNGAQTPVLSEFLGLFVTLIFLAMNGHLLTLSVLAESFRLLPVATTPIQADSMMALIRWSSILFSAGLLLALPLIAALLIANLAMGVLARVAPQLNIFAVGFPVTLVSGFVVLMFAIPYLGAAMERFFDQAFFALSTVLRAAGQPI
jgi:flagellar biosynthetic protein FliR